ncbi:MAG: DUF2238 domain-containing protein [Planctomycetes bacterium]|nr:DUF2238 domain-containing protein [Planctomycetota bacterium]
MKLTDKKAAEIPTRIGLVIVTAVLLALSLIRPPFPVEQALQHAPTVVALGLLLVAAQKNWLKTPAFCCVIAFLWLHILGARYIYSFVPYDDWLDGLFGIRLSDWFRLAAESL